jgi:protein arginine kinase activator
MDNKCPLTGKPCHEAKVFSITEKDGDSYKSFKICPKCYEKYLNPGTKMKPKPIPPDVKIDPAYADQFVKDLMVFAEEVIKNNPNVISLNQEKLKQKNCSNCGISLFDLVSKSKLGCADCYDFFQDELQSTLYMAHSMPHSPEIMSHGGKVPRNFKKKEPKKPTDEMQLVKLQYKMTRAVESEDYEAAAKLRDLIKELKKKI